MHLVCLDLEGVLVPEIWIAFAEAAGLPELRITTRDEPDYDKLMKYRIAILEREGLRLPDIQRVIGGMDPLPGAREFIDELKGLSPVIILSDTFSQFARPLMAKLGYPTLFCNSLVVAPDGKIAGYELRQKDGKRRSTEALKGLNFKVFAAGDSYNDLAMIRAADSGALFRAPEGIKAQCGDLPFCESYAEFMSAIKGFIASVG